MLNVKLVKKSLFIIMLLLAGNIHGQNLVNNPSFELVNEVDTRWSGTASKFNRKIKQWSSPTQGSPDLFYTKWLNKMQPRRPKVNLKNHTPRTGNFMVGVKVYGCQTSILHCKEYLQNGLKEKLEVGRKYYYEYWVCPISTSIKVNSFGIALSTERVNKTSIGFLEMNATYSTEERIDGDSTKWFKVSGVFESDSLYSHLIIGNFGEDEYIDFKNEENGLDYGFYLIDDVLLKPQNPSKEKIFKIDDPIILGDILFGFDKAIIQNNNLILDELAQFLTSNQGVCVKIEGHTDSVGSESHNLALSEKRANAVKIYLVQRGVKNARINTFGMGSRRPIVKNDTEENRTINRRVEIRMEKNAGCD